MIEPFPFAGLPIAVFGLGRSGLSAAHALGAAGAEVWAWDDDEGQRARAGEAGVPLVDLYERDWVAGEVTSLVLSPGVPLDHPEPHRVVKIARAAGCEVIGDVELLGRTMRDHQFIGITGTNGKSTTTALVGHILRLAGREVEVGGNLGIPVLDLRPITSDGVYVIEMSSYQLDLTYSITFDVAVLLNLTPDHIDRHGGFENYVASKKKIFHRQTEPRSAVVCIDDEPCRALFDALTAEGDQRIIPVAVGRRVEGGVYVLDGTLYDDIDGGATPVLDLTAIANLPGAHNWQNAAAAYAMTCAIDVDAPVVAACLQSFPGLAHRMELVAIVDGVRYVNDSKATNAAAADKALACYENVYWIAGGLPKEGGIADLAVRFTNIAHAFLIGEAADDFAAALGDAVRHEICGNLASAVAAAQRLAGAEGRDAPVVLLSPACASFDQFADFEARGDAFRGLVAALPGTREAIDEAITDGAAAGRGR